jgi:type VI secretion system Hcp family effector
VEGSRGPFPGDAAGSALIAALSGDYQVDVPFEPGSGLPTGRRQHRGFVVKKAPSAASLFFYEALINGERLRRVRVAYKKKGRNQQEYLVVTMSDVMVTSYNLSGPSGPDAAPVETIALNFARIEVTHPPSGKTVIDNSDGRR